MYALVPHKKHRDCCNDDLVLESFLTPILEKADDTLLWKLVILTGEATQAGDVQVGEMTVD